MLLKSENLFKLLNLILKYSALKSEAEKQKQKILFLNVDDRV